MKRLNFILVAMFLFIAGYSNAQVSAGDSCKGNCRMVSVENSNGLVTSEYATVTPPLWGPVGYANARYYYIPDIESYYDINSSRFIYLKGDNWIFNSKIPAQYANYDIDHGYKVVLTGYKGNTPYTHFNENKKKYPVGYRGQAQTTFKDNIVPRTANAPSTKPESEKH